MLRITRGSVWCGSGIILLLLVLAVGGAAAAVPAAPTLGYPANGGTVSAPVGFYWHVPTGATYYQIQVATESSFLSPVYLQGSATNSLTWSGAVARKYYWRVCAYIGSVQGPWSEVWSFTVGGTAPGAPTLVAPAKDSVVSAPITFQWNAPSSGATYYQVQAATESTFAAPTYVQGSATTSATWTSAPAKKYYWRVCAYNGTLQGPWSAVWTFTIPSGPPAAPYLQNPGPGANATSPVTFTWYAVTGATYYNLQVAKDTSFATLTYGHGSTATTQTWTGGAPGKYYWRVCAYAGSLQGPWSEVRYFTIPGTAPGAIGLYLPANGGTATAPVTFQWSQPGNATYFHLQVSSSTNFDAPLYTAGTATTNATWTGATVGTYYWRVNGYNGSLAGPWSAVWSFTIGTPAPAAPVLQYPANGASGSAPVTFQWYAVTGATYYQLQVSSSTSFDTPLFTKGGTATSQVWSTTGTGTFYWRVCAYNGTVLGPSSAVWHFTIPGGTTLAAPVLQNPTNGQNVIAPVTFQWGEVSGADHYEIQVSTTTASWATPALDQQTSLRTYKWTTTAHGTLYWRVCAWAGTVQGPWSSPWYFILSTDSLAAPVLTAPGNGTITSTPVSLAWSAVTNATYYQVQVSTNSNFTTTALTHGTSIPSYSWAATGTGTYYWRVCAYNAGSAQGPWSAVWSFTLASAPAAPALALPNNLASVTAPVTFTWSPPIGANYYHLQISTSTSFDSPLYQHGSTEPTQVWSGGTAGTYYWRVCGYAGSLAGAWSVVRSFTLH